MTCKNGVLSGVMGVIWIFIAPSAFSANSNQKVDDKAHPACDCTAGEELADGFVFAEPNELALLNARPLDLLTDARKEYRDHKNSLSAADIHVASELIKIQSAANLKDSHLKETATNLENLSQRVAKNEIKSMASLDAELTLAARDEARHHNLHAADAWTHHMAKNVGVDLTAAINATEKAADWSGQKFSIGEEKAIEATKSLSQKMASGGKWTEDEVGKGITSLGAEISGLGKKIEPTGERTK